jgi:O-succinylbenzoic acid--CoA ligase
VVRSYGSAETSGGCVYDGQPLDGVEVELSETGQIKLRGAVLAQNVADQTGWYVTNDLGEIGADGRLKVLGRTNRVLNSGGIKISLDLIEEAVRCIGGVVEAAAIAVTDNQWGERAAIVYVGSPEVADFIAADALSQLGPAAKPVRVIRVDVLPRLASGKPDYQALKSQFS